MTVEIWSDVVCPFCYIGKRHFETALAQFSHKEQVTVVPRSFELDPQASWDGESDLYDILSAKYGRNKQWAVEMSIGWLQFINIVGSALGAWWVTWIGFPLLGSSILLRLITGIGLLYGFLLFAQQQ